MGNRGARSTESSRITRPSNGKKVTEEQPVTEQTRYAWQRMIEASQQIVSAIGVQQEQLIREFARSEGVDLRLWQFNTDTVKWQKRPEPVL